ATVAVDPLRARRPRARSRGPRARRRPHLPACRARPGARAFAALRRSPTLAVFSGIARSRDSPPVSRAVEESNRRLLRARDAMDRSYDQPLDVAALARLARVSD